MLAYAAGLCSRMGWLRRGSELGGPRAARRRGAAVAGLLRAGGRGWRWRGRLASYAPRLGPAGEGKGTAVLPCTGDGGGGASAREGGTAGLYAATTRLAVDWVGARRGRGTACAGVGQCGHGRGGRRKGRNSAKDRRNSLEEVGKKRNEPFIFQLISGSVG